MTEFEAAEYPGNDAQFDDAGTGDFELEERQALRRVTRSN